jgi:hypothetical protein
VGTAEEHGAPWEVLLWEGVLGFVRDGAVEGEGLRCESSYIDCVAMEFCARC